MVRARRVLVQQLDVEHYHGSGSGAEPDANRSTTAGRGALSGPQVDGGQIAPTIGRLGQGRHLLQREVAVERQRLLSAADGFDVGANLFGRQGYVNPYIFQVSAGGDGNVRALAVPTLDEVRHPNLFDLDLRLAKNLKFQRVNLVLAADVFNVLNAGTVLQRNRNLGSAVFDSIAEIISPRILRVGVKFQF